MTKQERFMELVRLVVAQQKLGAEDTFVLYDCFLAMPDRCIPDEASLRYFVHDTVDYFLDRSSRCELNYSRAARYVSEWRDTWAPESTESVHSPNCMEAEGREDGLGFSTRAAGESID